jgi:hypothetical protein
MRLQLLFTLSALRVPHFAFNFVFAPLEFPGLFPVPALAQAGFLVALERKERDGLGLDEFTNEFGDREPGAAGVNLRHFEKPLVSLNQFGQ